MGCDELKKRFESHKSEISTLRTQVEGSLDALKSIQDTNKNAQVKFKELKDRQERLHMHVLQVMRKLEKLRTQGEPLNADERR